MFFGGNCLELAGTGILNHIPCNDTFSSGCPDSYYYGKEIYKYPQCLAINTTLRCFESDTKCIKSRLVNRSAVEWNGTTEQTKCSTKTQSENDFKDVIIILSILLAVAIFSFIGLLLKWIISNKKRKNETEDFHYSTPHSSENDSHHYNKYTHVSDEDSNKGWKPLVNDRESSSQTDPQSFSSPSNDERDSFYKDMIDRNMLASREDSCQSDQQNYPSQSQEHINQGFKNDEFQSDSKKVQKSRRPAHRSRVNTSSNSSHVFFHHIVCCVSMRTHPNLVESNHQQVPYASADEISACILAKLRTNTNLPDNVTAPTTLPKLIDFVQETTKSFGTESKSESTSLNEDDTDDSEPDDDKLSLKIQANTNDLHLRSTEYLEIDNSTCSQKPRNMEMDKKKSESAVEIKRKASKQTKEEASLEQAKSITLSNSTKTSEQKEQKKENVLSFDNIKDKGKKERLRPMERRMGEEWEIEPKKFFDFENIPPAKERETSRKMKRSKTRDDLRDIFQRSDKRNKRDSDKRRARTFIGDSRSKIKSERERQGDKSTMNVVMETSFSRDNWQRANSNCSLQDEREISQSEITCYTIQEYIGSAPSSQKKRESSSDSGEVENILSAPENR